MRLSFFHKPIAIKWFFPPASASCEVKWGCWCVFILPHCGGEVPTIELYCERLMFVVSPRTTGIFENKKQAHCKFAIVPARVCWCEMERSCCLGMALKHNNKVLCSYELWGTGWHFWISKTDQRPCQTRQFYRQPAPGNFQQQISFAFQMPHFFLGDSYS